MKETDFNLPNPQMLIKRAKEETIPVSLRVKESTVAIFDKMAKEAGVNRGAMMNTWLDFYAQSQNPSNEDNSKDIMISFLNSERFWKTTPSLTTEELFYRIPSIKCKGFHLNGTEDARELYAEYKSNDAIGSDDLIACIDGNEIWPCDGEPNCGNLEPDEEVYLDVTLKQWPLVTVLLGEYRKKYERLFPEQEYAITHGMLRKIADVCKMYKEPDGVLATAIKDVLLDYVEKQNG